MNGQEARSSLRGIGLLQAVPDAALEGLSRRCAWKRYDSGQVIVDHHEGSTDVFFIASGQVRAKIYSLSGREVTFRDIGAGDIFGELAAIDGEPRSAAVVATKPSLVGAMSAAVLQEVLRDFPDVAAALLRRLSRQIRRLSDRIFEFSTLTVEHRVHAELLRLAWPYAKDENRARISPAPTHAELASMISTHREAVTRELNKLARQGLLKREGKSLVILDVARLVAMVQEVRGD
jgi:CRP-like cAMP-binding protein